MRGQVAHVPHTIVTPFNYGDGEGNGQFYGQQQAGGASKSRHLTGGNVVSEKTQTQPNNGGFILK